MRDKSWICWEFLAVLMILISIGTLAFPDIAEGQEELQEKAIVRGQVAAGDFTWYAQNFPGFFYDIDSDTGTEVLTSALSDGKLSGSYPYGLTYQSASQENDFEFADWGSCKVIGFMGEKCFAGYIDTPDSIDDSLYEDSGDANVLVQGQLLKILADDDAEQTITTDTALQLEDGYVLSIDSIDIDGNVVTLILSRDGTEVARKKVSPSMDGATMADRTFIFKKDVGHSRDVVVIAVHFKNAFRGSDTDLATVDGIWQLSDRPIIVSGGTKYEKMVVKSVTDDTVIMNNQGSDIVLSRNKEVSIMPGIFVRTADSDELRYYVCKEVTKPGTYELRGAVAVDSNTWNAQNFGGFYYDINGDIQTEELTATITSGNFVEPGGIIYSTGTLADDFEFEDWGSYKVMGFLGEKCFAGYIESSDPEEGYLFEKSTIKNALAEGQIMKVLADDDTERTVTSNTPLLLAENYSLELKNVNPEDGRVFVELHKDGQLVDTRMFQPSKENAAMSDQTYLYRNPQVGSQKNLVTIAVHFKNAFKGADQDLATVDGVWQISESPISVAEGTAFDKLVISYVTSDQISMENIDSPITLSRNEDVSLAGDISIKMADSDSFRYYIYKEVEITESAIPSIDRQVADVFTGTTRESVTTLEKSDLSGAKDRGEPSEEVAETGDPVQRLKALKELMDAGLITEEEYADKKADILSTV